MANGGADSTLWLAYLPPCLGLHTLTERTKTRK